MIPTAPNQHTVVMTAAGDGAELLTPEVFSLVSRTLCGTASLILT